MKKIDALMNSASFELQSINDIDISKATADFTFINQDGEVVSDYHDFFYNTSKGYQNLHLSRILVLVEKESKEILAFMSLQASGIQLSKEERRLTYGKDIPFSLSPCVSIGQLSVSNYGRTKYKNVGSLMLYFAKAIAISLEKNHAACRFLTVDANVEKNLTVTDFYEKNGFIDNAQVNTKKRRTISMRKDIFEDSYVM